jgi:hypothetical protein
MIQKMLQWLLQWRLHVCLHKIMLVVEQKEKPKKEKPQILQLQRRLLLQMLVEPPPPHPLSVTIQSFIDTRSIASHFHLVAEHVTHADSPSPTPPTGSAPMGAMWICVMRAMHWQYSQMQPNQYQQTSPPPRQRQQEKQPPHRAHHRQQPQQQNQTNQAVHHIKLRKQRLQRQ